MRQRAIDLLYAMCDRSNAKTIVEELLQYLETADYSIRETLVSSTGTHKAHLVVQRNTDQYYRHTPGTYSSSSEKHWCQYYRCKYYMYQHHT